MQRVLGVSLVNRRPAQVDAQHVTKGRCYRCVEGIVGTESEGRQGKTEQQDTNKMQ